MLKNAITFLLALCNFVYAVQYRGNKDGEFFEMQLRRDGDPMARRSKSGDETGSMVLTLVADAVLLATLYVVVRFVVQFGKKRMGYGQKDDQGEAVLTSN